MEILTGLVLLALILFLFAHIERENAEVREDDGEDEVGDEV